MDSRVTSHVSDGLVLLVTISVLLAALATPAAAAVGADQSRQSPAVASGERSPTGGVQQVATNNSTVRHEDPELATGTGNTTNTQRWLSDRIERAFVECARRAQVGSNTTCEILAEESESLALRYERLAEQTEETDDDNASAVLEPVAEDQLQFVEAVEEYRSTRTAYRRAKAREGVNRTQELAREVSQRGDRVGIIGDRLTDRYRVIRSNSSLAVTPAIIAVEEVTINVTQETTEIRNTEFEAPAMRFSTNATTVSFADPAEFSGQLSTQDGIALSNRTIVVQTPGTTTQLLTDSTGSFSFTYRPGSVSPGNKTVVARYAPRNDSRYTAVRVGRELPTRNSTGTVAISGSPSTVAFGDELRITGSYRVDGVGVEGVPLEISLGGVPLTEVETGESGSFSTAQRVPKGVPNGSADLSATIADDGIVLKGEPASASLAVEQSTPRLVVGAERINASTARIFGRVSVGEVAVPNGPIQINRGDTTLATARSTPSGSFEVNVTLPDTPPSQSVALTVAYTAEGGNLAPATLDAQVGSAPAGLLPSVDRPSAIEVINAVQRLNLIPFIAGGGLILLVLLVLSLVAYRTDSRIVSRLRSRLGRQTRLGGATTGEGIPPQGAAGGGDPVATRGLDGEELLSSARDQYEAERPDDAIVTAYSAARQRLDERLGIDQTLTHWELLFLYRELLDTADRAALERLTSAYERAAFSPSASTVELAREAIENANEIVNDPDTRSRGAAESGD
ncbi:hypothetical protein [Salinigranum sp. GCM10025319]|uniref:hypothetical protein n=1 Tax=Salinigranum sp. GCM10025319 TaxID=3252687 RepID=UPI0036237DD4